MKNNTKLHNWKYTSRNLIIDTAKIIRALEKLAKDELEHRKLIESGWQVEENANLTMISAKLNLAKLEYAVKSNEKSEAVEHHSNLVSSLRQVRDNLREETMYTSDLENNKNLIIRHISGVSTDLRKHRLQILASIE